MFSLLKNRSTGWTIALTALLVGCSQEISGPDPADTELALAKGRPVACNAETSLRITLPSSGSALQNDLAGDYVEGVDNVGAHISGNGNLMFWTSQYGATTRVVNITTTAGSFVTTDRIYTNNHDNPGSEADACGLTGPGLQPGSTGTAVLEAELDADGIVRYGKSCDGGLVDDAGVSERVDVVRSADGATWTISGASGVHCRHNGLRGKNSALVEVGQAGSFSMTLVAIGS